MSTFLINDKEVFHKNPISAIIYRPLPVNLLHFFLGSTLNACWESRPAPLSTQSQVHSGSFLLALYQHWLQRCESGPCVCWTRVWVVFSLEADYVFCRCACTHECAYVCPAGKCVWSEGSDPKPLPRGPVSLSLQRPTGARSASLPAKGGNPVYVAPASHGRTRNTTASHRLPPHMQV